MNDAKPVAGVPAMERAIVGLCHDLNDQLAAINAYVFLLERRGALEDASAPLHEHLDRLASTVRMVRSLCRDQDPDVSPVALSLLAESASEVMAAYPEGSVAYRVESDQAGVVVRGDWTRVLRSLLLVGAWASRGVTEPVTVTLGVAVPGATNAIAVRAVGELPAPHDGWEGPPDPTLAEIEVERTGERSATIRLGRRDVEGTARATRGQ